MSDFDVQEQKKSTPWTGIAICVLVLALIAFGLHSVMSGKAGKKPTPPKISLMAPPPPPPPPPPKFEKKIEPPKDVKEVKIDQQVQKPEPPAPAPELKMEGAAGDGPSSFASGNITSEDLSKMGTGKGALSEGINFNSYSMMLKSELQRYLSKNGNLRHEMYKVEVRIWLAADGNVKKAELISGTGDEATDEEIKKAMETVPKFPEAPPQNMPQPIRLRIASTGRH